MRVLQSNFQKGFNLLSSSFKLEDGEYYLLKNGRVRNNNIKPIHKAVEVTGFPDGLLQGIYSYESKLLVFADGKAFIKDYVGGSGFKKVYQFSMADDVKTIHAEFVPPASFVLERKSAGTNAAVDIKKEVLGNHSTPRIIICQDGKNRPRLITIGGLAQIAQDYQSWSRTNRTYVPIGSLMTRSGEILYLVDPTGNKIMRSVSGRPIDFMVVIDNNGDKLNNELDGGATAVSHAVDYDPITCIRSLNTADGTFFVSTRRHGYLVIPNFDRTLFAEPTFINIDMFKTGSINQFTFIELIGDYAFIDSSGIRSFNAVQQLKNKGANAPFSAKCEALFTGITQTDAACINFDNYALFAVTTVYGPGIVVFDTVTQSFVGVDLFEDINSNIVQFAQVDNEQIQRLFCRTADNKVYELYSEATGFEQCSFIIREQTTGNEVVKPQGAGAAMTNIYGSGNISMTAYVDNVIATRVSTNINTVNVRPVGVKAFPFGAPTTEVGVPIYHDMKDVLSGLAVTVEYSWNFDAELAFAFVDVQHEQFTSFKQLGIQVKDMALLNKGLK